MVFGGSGKAMSFRIPRKLGTSWPSSREEDPSKGVRWTMEVPATRGLMVFFSSLSVGDDFACLDKLKTLPGSGKGE